MATALWISGFQKLTPNKAKEKRKSRKREKGRKKSNIGLIIFPFRREGGKEYLSPDANAAGGLNLKWRYFFFSEGDVGKKSSFFF